MPYAITKFTYDPFIGGYSTMMQVKEAFTYKLPPNLLMKRAAPILWAGATVFTPIKKLGPNGGKCGVVGIGGLGHLAVQYASKLGMKVYAFSTSN